MPNNEAQPTPTNDRGHAPGADIPIEARASDEVLTVTVRDDYCHASTVAVAPAGTRAVNYAFDVTPARLISGLITERGIARAGGLLDTLFPEQAAASAALAP